MHTEYKNTQIKFYLDNNKQLDMDTIYTKAHQHLLRMYGDRSDIMDIIPDCKHRELSNDIKHLVSSDIKDEDVLSYTNNIVNQFRKIEEAGLCTKDGFEFTRYNPFTRTGRPSNSNKGINYAALNKDDGSRNRFISRFPGGILADFDFDAYHLRLICGLIDYDPPTESFHKHLGEIYFDTKQLTSDQYEESKKITFRILYGGVPKELESVPYFSLVKQYIDGQWKLFNEQEYIETPIFKRKLYKKNFPKMNSQKLFNYIIQAYETEMNATKLSQVFDLLDGKESKMILYTYDSFLFDISPNDGKALIKEIQEILEYPTSVHIGKNYGNMMNYTG